MCRWACTLTCLHTWLLCDVWDRDNQALQFSANCVNENAPSLFMTSNKAGTRSGLICSWMREAVETAACLACVWVTELVRDGGWEGTSGPQLVCHSLNLLPAAITSGRLGQDQGLIVLLRVKSALWTVATDSLTCAWFLIHLNQTCQTVDVVFFPHPLVCSLVCLFWRGGVKIDDVLCLWA